MKQFVETGAFEYFQNSEKKSKSSAWLVQSIGPTCKFYYVWRYEILYVLFYVKNLKIINNGCSNKIIFLIQFSLKRLAYVHQFNRA